VPNSATGCNRPGRGGSPRARSSASAAPAATARRCHGVLTRGRAERTREPVPADQPVGRTSASPSRCWIA
jgi:hypothetical protein